MLRLWICWSVFFIGAILSPASQGVTIDCEKEAQAQVKDNLTLSCVLDDPSCKVVKYDWENDTNGVICNEISGGGATRYTCGVYNVTHLYLNISSVVKSMEGNYSIKMQTDCGTTNRADVSVTIHERATAKAVNGSSVKQAPFVHIGIITVLVILVS